MQKLDFPKRDDPTRIDSIDYHIPEKFVGIDAAVQDGKEGVVLVIDGRSVMLSIAGARDLALALRQSANRVQKLCGF